VTRTTDMSMSPTVPAPTIQQIPLILDMEAVGEASSGCNDMIRMFTTLQEALSLDPMMDLTTETKAVEQITGLNCHSFVVENNTLFVRRPLSGQERLHINKLLNRTHASSEPLTSGEPHTEMDVDHMTVRVLLRPFEKDAAVSKLYVTSSSEASGQAGTTSQSIVVATSGAQHTGEGHRIVVVRCCRGRTADIPGNEVYKDTLRMRVMMVFAMHAGARRAKRGAEEMREGSDYPMATVPGDSKVTGRYNEEGGANLWVLFRLLTRPVDLHVAGRPGGGPSKSSPVSVVPVGDKDAPMLMNMLNSIPSERLVDATDASVQEALGRCTDAIKANRLEMEINSLRISVQMSRSPHWLQFYDLSMPPALARHSPLNRNDMLERNLLFIKDAAAWTVSRTGPKFVMAYRKVTGEDPLTMRKISAQAAPAVCNVHNFGSDERQLHKATLTNMDPAEVEAIRVTVNKYKKELGLGALLDAQMYALYNQCALQNPV
jgi:hypothetical protein